MIDAIPPRRAALRLWLSAAALLLAANAASAQSVGGFQHDASKPIEIGADALEVRQADNMAVFSGNVDARQGGARLQADRVEVTYDTAAGAGAGALQRLRAEGSVHISSDANVARGDWADYDVPAGQILMGDNVLLSQGPGNAIQGARLRIDLNTGRAVMEGRGTAQSGGASPTGGGVSMVFTPGSVSP